MHRQGGEGLTPDGRNILRQLLVRHESYNQFPYPDTRGFRTIGIGRNLDTRGIPRAEAVYLLDDDIDYFLGRLPVVLPFFHGMSENRQIVLVYMCFNLGVKGLLEFKNMILALECGDHERAAHEMMKSRWAAQVGARADMLASIMKSDILPNSNISS